MKTKPKSNLTAEEFLTKETKKTFEEFRERILEIFDDYESKLHEERTARFLPVIKI